MPLSATRAAAADSTLFVNLNVVSMEFWGVGWRGGGGGRGGGVHVAHVRRRERAEPEEGEGVGGG